MANHYSTITKTSLETMQWFIFMLANSIALPIVVASIYQLDFQALAELMQRTFFVVGIASVLQGLLGYRLPVMEGPAGLWISMFSVMAVTGASQGMSSLASLQVLQMTMIFTGIFLLLFGLFRIAEKALPLFTPLVTGSFIFLLTVQLSGTFLKGMLGIQEGTQTIEPMGTMLAFFTFFLVLGLSILGRGWVSNYAVLIGIIAGWILYRVLAGTELKHHAETTLFAVPELLAWGVPALDFSLIPAAFVIAVILLSNVVASVVAAGQAISGKPSFSDSQINRGSTVLGLNHGIAGLFSAIANVPLATSAGFISLTGQKRKRPFIYAALCLIAVSFFPALVAIISGIPSPVANAALLAVFVQLMGLGLSNIASEDLTHRRLTIIGISFLLGIGIMFLPLEVFIELPGLVQNLASNGLLVGTALVILLEQLWKENEPAAPK